VKARKGRFGLEKITREEYTLDWSQSKVSVVLKWFYLKIQYFI